MWDNVLVLRLRARLSACPARSSRAFSPWHIWRRYLHCWLPGYLAGALAFLHCWLSGYLYCITYIVGYL